MRSDLLHGQIPSGARVTEHWAAGHYEVRRALEGLSVERAGSVRGARPQIEALRRVWTEAAPDPGEEVLYRDEA
jgi:DNA-binding GntR family transcriptional regulator